MRKMNSFAQIAAVTFDVGGTLIEPWPSVGHIYSQMAARYGVESIPAKALNQRFGAAWTAHKSFNYTRADWAALVAQTFRGLTGALPSESFFDELYLHFGLPEAWRVFDDVLPALEALATRGLKLGIVSNWDERLRPLLQELQLSQYFEAMVISCEVGFCKPDRVIFEEAARKLALPTTAILHIGDNPKTDTVGAQGAGMHALELRRGAADNSEGRIRSLDEVVEMLRG